MTWRGTATAQDRFFGSLTYLLPLMEVSLLASTYAGMNLGLFAQFPFLRAILIPLMPLLVIYGTIPFASLIVFILLLTLVVRNSNIGHFIRFNTMQAILLSIVVFISQVLLSMVLLPVLGAGLVMDTLVNVVVLGVFAAVFYCIAQTVLGRYAEIPTLSEAVHMQVR